MQNTQQVASIQRTTLTSYTRSDDLPALRPGSVESVLLFREALAHKLRSEFGRNACLMTTANPYQPVLPSKPITRGASISSRSRRQAADPAADPSSPQPPPGTLIFDDESDTELCRRKQMKKYYEEHSRLADVKEKMFQVMVGNISDDSIQKLSED